MNKVAAVIAMLVLGLVSVNLIQAQGDAETDEAVLPDLPGRIAYVGADFNVYALSPQENARVQLTDNAGVGEGMLQIYRFPTWSQDGRLAYFGSSINAVEREQQIDIFISQDGTEDGELVYTGVNEAFNYAYWSPQNCADGEDCRDLAVLLSGARAGGGLYVEMIRDGGEEFENDTIGSGAPFYYSWSPDGTRMLWQRNNQRVDIYDVADGDVIETLPQMPGQFFAPAWSPVDDRLLFGELQIDGRDSTTNLVIVANDETETLVEELDGLVYFSWSPDGNKVAYMTCDIQRICTTLTVVDAVSGEQLAESSDTGLLSFFWSPDSLSIAYVTITDAADGFVASADAKADTVLMKRQQREREPELMLRWSVLDVENDETRDYSRFTPTNEMTYLFTYFDQFAQSHRIWSPDSKHLLYSEMTQGQRPVIAVLDVTRDGTVPLFIADGVLGVWSFE